MRSKQVATLVFLLFVFFCSPTHAQVVATWTDGSGLWSTAASWSTSPTVPNNSATNAYNVVINGTGSDVITFDAGGTVINTLSIGAGEMFQDNGLAPTLTLVGPPTTVSGTTGTIFNSGTINWGNGANLVIDMSTGDQSIESGQMNFTNSSLTFRDSSSSHTGLMANASATFDNSVLAVQGNSYINGDSHILLRNGSVANISGSLTNFTSQFTLSNSSMTVGGEYHLSGGDLTLNSSVLNIGGQFFDNDSDVYLRGGSYVKTAGDFYYGIGSMNVDGSSFLVAGNYLSGGGGPVTRVQNGGFLSIGGNYAPVVWEELDVTGSSKVIVAGDMMPVRGSVTESGSTLAVGGNFTSGSGMMVQLQNRSLLTVGGTFTNLPSADSAPTLQLIGQGNVANLHAVQNSGIIQVDAGSTLVVSGGGFGNNSGGSLALGGAMNVTGGFNNSGGSVIVNPAATLTTDRYLQSGGSTDISGTLLTGSFSQSGGSTAIESSGLMKATTFTATGGTVTINGILDPAAVEFGSGATLQGSGTVFGNVAMGGTVSNSGGTLTVFGNYEQVGNGTLEALISPTSRALLDIHGDVALGGGSLLDLMLADGYDPLGQTFVIMQYASLVGQFSNGNSFCEDGYLWNITYGVNQIDVTAVATPEPGALVLLVVGLICLTLLSCRRWGGVVRSLWAAQ